MLSGPPLDPPGPGTRLAEALGATVHQLATADRDERDATVARVVAELRAAGRRPFVIGVGGSGLPGTYGQFEAASEAFGQLAALDVRPQRPVPAVGDGRDPGRAGRRERRRRAASTARSSASSSPDRRPSSGRRSRRRSPVSRRWSGRRRVPPEAIVLDGSQFGDGYGRPTAAAEEATRLLGRTEGILVDPIYTAKALAALVARARSGELDGQTVVFWHAGGTPGLFEPLD